MSERMETCPVCKSTGPRVTSAWIGPAGCGDEWHHPKEREAPGDVEGMALDIAHIIEMKARSCMSGDFSIPPDIAAYLAGFVSDHVLALLDAEKRRVAEVAASFIWDKQVLDKTIRKSAIAEAVAAALGKGE